MYNREPRRLAKSEATAHTYGTASLRNWNDAVNGVFFVSGLARDIDCSLMGTLKNYALIYLRINGADYKMAGSEATAYGVGGSSVNFTAFAGYNTMYIMELGNSESAFFADCRLNSIIKM